MSKRAPSASVIICIGLGMALCGPASSAGEELVSQDALIQDARQLAEAIETAHPDPYTQGGGKLSFHRRLQAVLAAIPTGGLSRSSFYGLLLPLVSAIGDGHTAIRLGSEGNTLERQTALPLVYRVVEEQLVVAGAFDQKGKRLFGARLGSVEGVAVAELERRHAHLRGAQTRLETLARLSLGLSNRAGLARLVPEWRDRSRLRLAFVLPDGKREEVIFDVPGQAKRRLHVPDSRVRLPDTGKAELGFGFLDSKKQVGYLRIDGMMAYREALQAMQAKGMSEVEGYAREAYRQLHGGQPPKDMDKVVAGIPAAAEVFGGMVGELRRAKTRTLIVDLRKNTGGNSILKEILVYYLYGRQAMQTIQDGYQIKKFSPLYFKVYSKDSLAKVNQGRKLPLMAQGYDFSEEIAFRDGSTMAKRDAAYWADFFEGADGFLAELASGAFARPAHKVEKVIVLCSTLTYSSGFNLMRDLYALGAVLVGSASAQSGNNFGDSLPFTLTHTGIQAFVSHKANISFPDDPERGRTLRPHHELTYPKLAATGFDPNAEVRLALDELR